MLVLPRNEGGRISIGPDIEVTVVGVRKGKAKVGFAGSPQVSICREEVKRRKAEAESRCFSSRMERNNPDESFT